MSAEKLEKRTDGQKPLVKVLIDSLCRPNQISLPMFKSPRSLLHIKVVSRQAGKGDRSLVQSEATLTQNLGRYVVFLDTIVNYLLSEMRSYETDARS